MEAQSIKNLELSRQDFDLIIKGLESIAKSESSTEMLQGMFKAILLGDKPDILNEVERKEAIEKAKRKREADIMNENIQLLTGKIIKLKRLLIENDLMESLK